MSLILNKGETMEPHMSTGKSSDKQIAWADVTHAAADVEANRVHRERMTDTVEIALTLTDKAAIADVNAADDAEKIAAQGVLDDLKSKIKEAKATIDAIDARMKDRNRTCRTGTQAKTAEWIVETTFATNTVTYIDPETGQIVHTRAMADDERQLELTSDNLLGKVKADAAPESSNSEAINDPEALLRAAEEGDGKEDPEPEDESLDSEDE